MDQIVLSLAEVFITNMTIALDTIIYSQLTIVDR